MEYYGGKELAEAFRTVRKNTIQIAEDIPEEKYGFRATPDVQTVAQELAHVACATWWQLQAHSVDKKTFITFEDFGVYMGKVGEREQALTTKTQIVEALRREGDEFARFLESLTEAQLSERVSFPPPIQPSTKSAVRDAARGQGARDASPREDDGDRAPDRHRPAPHARAAAESGGAHCGRGAGDGKGVNPVTASALGPTTPSTVIANPERGLPPVICLTHIGDGDSPCHRGTSAPQIPR